MVAIGNFFFKYRNLLFPVFALSVFIPSTQVFNARAFGESYYWIPLVSGLVVAVLGQSIRAVTIALKYIIRGGKDKKVHAEELVVEGIFHHSRNPLYLGNILMLTGASLVSNSAFFLFITLPLFCFIYQAIVLAEEDFLRNKFGEQYDLYAQTVNRWIPSLKGLGTTFSSGTFNFKRYLFSEYNTLYMLIAALYILILTRYPFMTELTTREKFQYSGIVIGLITLPYFTIRYFKKSGKKK